jgi:hypothetical protein
VPEHLRELLPKTFLAHEVDVLDPPFVRQASVARENGAVLGQPETNELLVRDRRIVRAVEAQDSEPARQATEHGIGGKASLGSLLDRAHPGLDPDSMSAGALDRAAELEQRNVVLAAAVPARNRHLVGSTPE